MEINVLFYVCVTLSQLGWGCLFLFKNDKCHIFGNVVFVE